MKRYFAFCLSLILALQLFGCSAAAPEAKVIVGGKPRDLMAKIVPAAVEPLAPDQVYENAAAEFAFHLLREGYTEGGITLSPYSLYLLLAMTANGAEGNTLAQLEQALGLPCSELNRYLYHLRNDPRQELLLANSIWFRESQELQVKESFLQTNGDYYDAQLYRADFTQQTVAEINAWIAAHTKGRIDELIRQLDPNDCMILLNALCFDGQWAEAFDPENSYDGSFTAWDETVQDARMMQGSAEKYIREGNTTGFVKEYENGYSFLALLPEEGQAMEDFLAGLSGEKLLQLWRSASQQKTAVTMPQMELESELSAVSILQKLGVTDLFGDTADLRRISDADLYVSALLHRCSVAVDETGTTAAGASSAIITYKGIPKSVVLDRPFVYAILDNETGTILFLGVVASVE